MKPLPVLLTMLAAAGCSSSSSGGTTPKPDAGDVDSAAPGDGGETDSATPGDASEGDGSTPGDAATEAGEAGTFLCSGIPCSAGEYCWEHEGADAGAEAGPNAQCRPFPSACAAAQTCSCLETATSCGTCVPNGDSFTVLCE